MSVAAYNLLAPTMTAAWSSCHPKTRIFFKPARGLPNCMTTPNSHHDMPMNEEEQ
jgi:hypothetical protein